MSDNPDWFHGTMHHAISLDLLSKTIYSGGLHPDRSDQIGHCVFHGAAWDKYCLDRGKIKCPYRSDEKCPADKITDEISRHWPGSNVKYAKDIRSQTLDDIREQEIRKESEDKTKADSIQSQ